MKHFNRAAAILVCLFIVAAPFTRCFYSYADDQWINVNSDSQLANAFRDYCKSRDLTIEGSGADAITSWTTQTFNTLCNRVGIDITELQAEVKYKVDNSNNVTQWFFTQTGIGAFNRLFAQFLQDNELAVGDSANQTDDTVYDGYIYNGSLVYVLTQFASQTTSDVIVQKGTAYNGITYNNFLGQSSGTISNYTPFPNQTVNLTLTINTNDGTVYWLRSNNGNQQRIYWYSPFDYVSVKGELAYYMVNNDSNLYFGLISLGYRSNGTLDGWKYLANFATLNNSSPSTATVYLTTNNTVINNNNYEGDTIINNNGTQNEPEGGTPPNWDLGGGEGTADDGNGNTWNITWPSFELPDLNIDWTINGLSEKFPFSIPFDLVSLVQVLSAEPEAPRFAGTIDLKVYQWNYDLDFSQFNSVAAVFRTAETLLFIFGLIMITRKIIRG